MCFIMAPSLSTHTLPRVVRAPDGKGKPKESKEKVLELVTRYSGIGVNKKALQGTTTAKLREVAQALHERLQPKDGTPIAEGPQAVKEYLKHLGAQVMLAVETKHPADKGLALFDLSVKDLKETFVRLHQVYARYLPTDFKDVVGTFGTMGLRLVLLLVVQDLLCVHKGDESVQALPPCVLEGKMGSGSTLVVELFNMLHGKSGEVEQEDDTTTTTVPNSQAAVKKAKAAATPVQIDLDEHGASQLAEDEDALFEAQMLLQKQQASKRKMFFAGKGMLRALQIELGDIDHLGVSEVGPAVIRYLETLRLQFRAGHGNRQHPADQDLLKVQDAYADAHANGTKGVYSLLDIMARAPQLRPMADRCTARLERLAKNFDADKKQLKRERDESVDGLAAGDVAALLKQLTEADKKARVDTPSKDQHEAVGKTAMANLVASIRDKFSVDHDTAMRAAAKMAAGRCASCLSVWGDAKCSEATCAGRGEPAKELKERVAKATVVADLGP